MSAMRIILSPTKKMNEDPDSLPCGALPVFLDRTEQILSWLRSRSPEQLQTLWGCNDRIAAQNLERLRDMDLRSRLTPAILAYEGIAFQYMAPAVFADDQLAYVQDHLRILSGFYGALKPLDGVRPYRLEMQARAKIGGHPDLYSFWGHDLYEEIRPESGVILNLASKEYSRCIEKYLSPADTFVTCTFAETVKGKLVQKGTFAKMARGEMVRFLAEHHVQSPEGAKAFDRLDFHFREDLSSETELIFERIPTE